MILIKEFPKLFSRSANGTREISIKVYNDDNIGIIETEHGLITGVKQKTIVKIYEGKNLGKRNETNAISQALSEAESKWNKKNKIAFEKLSDLDNGSVKFIAPMLAKKYRDAHKHIKFPAYVQPKLDGVRCISEIDNDEESLFFDINYTSRTGKKFEALHGLDDDLFKINMDKPLDGEIYTSDIDFEEICSAVRRNKQTNILRDKLQYWVYDVIDTSKDFNIRNKELLYKFIQYGKYDILKQTYHIGKVYYCPTYLVNSKEEILAYHKKFVQAGYEGTMIRNAKGGYTIRKRSSNLQKLKDFVTDEFEIANVIDGVGKNEGTAIFVCKANNGKLFNVSPIGSFEQRKEYYLNKDCLIGKQLTVKYQALSRYGIPKFANGLTIRDYE